MNEWLTELVQVIATGGIGAILGFAAGVWFADQHHLHAAETALVESVLTEAERDPQLPATTPPRRESAMSRARRALPRLHPDRITTITVLAVMVALLLTGVAWIVNARDARSQVVRDQAQDARICRVINEIVGTLQRRTEVYREAALPERRLWKDFRRMIARSNIDGSNDEALASIDRYLARQDSYLQHLKGNPYPVELAEDCDQ